MITIFFYEKILARIKAAVPEIKHIDLWNNQIAMEHKELPFNRPAVFVEMEEVQWKQQLEKQQEGDLNFKLRVVTDTQSVVTDSTQTQPNRTKGLARLLLFEKVWVAVNHYQEADASGNNQSQFSKIVRTGSVLDTNNAQLNMDVHSFKTHLTDAAAVPEYDTADLNLRIEGVLVDELP